MFIYSKWKFHLVNPLEIYTASDWNHDVKVAFLKRYIKPSIRTICFLVQISSAQLFLMSLGLQSRAFVIICSFLVQPNILYISSYFLQSVNYIISSCLVTKLFSSVSFLFPAQSWLCFSVQCAVSAAFWCPSF